MVKFAAKSKRGRPRKTGGEYRVSVEQVSKRTCAVRLRWMRADGVEDCAVVNRFADAALARIETKQIWREGIVLDTLLMT